MDRDKKSYLSPSTLSSTFLKMLRRNTRRRRHSMPVATETRTASIAWKQCNPHRKEVIAEKPLNQPEFLQTRRQRCVTENGKLSIVFNATQKIEKSIEFYNSYSWHSWESLNNSKLHKENLQRAEKKVLKKKSF